MQSSNEHCFAIRGVIDFNTVVQWRKAIEDWLEQAIATHLRIDFAPVLNSNASVLTLMLALMRKAKKLNKELVFAHVPASLLQIAQICDVRILLPVE